MGVEDDVTARHAEEVALAEERARVTGPGDHARAREPARLDPLGRSPQRPVAGRRSVLEVAEQELRDAAGAAHAEEPAVEDHSAARERIDARARRGITHA